MNKSIILAVFILLLNVCSNAQGLDPKMKSVIQKPIPRVDAMPNQPRPYKMKDWRQTALGFDKYTFDYSQKGKFLPFIWDDNQNRNFKSPTFGMYTAIGDVREGPKINNGENHEALGAMGAILGATLVGIDKSKQGGKNYVSMVRNYFNKDNGWNIVMNFTNKGAHIGGGYGNDYWYDVYNNVLFYAIGNYYPKVKGYSEIMKTVADQFAKSDSIMGNSYSYSFFDFKNMMPGKNHIPTQEDVAGGYAFILYSAYLKYGDVKYLKAAKNALKVLEGLKDCKNYELLLPFAAYIGARLNIEEGTNYNIQKFLDCAFDGTANNREGWGVLVGNWGGYDISGISGSTIDRGGYGFAMNTFDLAWPLTAMVRYDQSYARAVGKWILNAANAARLFYPYDVPDSLQALPHLKAITKNVIAYEGLIRRSDYPNMKGKAFVAQGDGPLWAPGMPQETMFSLYGSGHVGIFGGIIKTTNVPEILQIDCRKTDMFRKYEAYPTFLYYNPYSTVKKVTINLGKKRVDVYDAVNRKLLKSNINGQFSFDIMSDATSLLVFVPAGSKYKVTVGKLLANGIPIDFQYH